MPTASFLRLRRNCPRSDGPLPAMAVFVCAFNSASLPLNRAGAGLSCLVQMQRKGRRQRGNHCGSSTSRHEFKERPVSMNAWSVLVLSAPLWSGLSSVHDDLRGSEAIRQPRRIRGGSAGAARETRALRGSSAGPKRPAGRGRMGEAPSATRSGCPCRWSRSRCRPDRAQISPPPPPTRSLASA